MRNYKAKPSHGINTAHSFHKSDRKYPQPKAFGRSSSQKPKGANKQNKMFQPVQIVPVKNQIAPVKSNQMQQQCQNITINKNQRNDTPTNQLFYSQPIISNNNKKQVFHFLAQQPFSNQSTSITNDSYCLWFKRLQSDASNMKTIKIHTSDYVISNWNGDQFPNTFYICFDGISGFLDKHGSMTNRLAALQLKQIQPVMQNQSITYELKYACSHSHEWIIPESISNLKMTLTTDQNSSPILLPLPNALSVEVEVTQSTKKNNV